MTVYIGAFQKTGSSADLTFPFEMKYYLELLTENGAPNQILDLYIEPKYVRLRHFVFCANLNYAHFCYISITWNLFHSPQNFVLFLKYLYLDSNHIETQFIWVLRVTGQVTDVTNDAVIRR